MRRERRIPICCGFIPSVDVSVHGVYDQTSLFWAALGGLEACVRELLGTGKAGAPCEAETALRQKYAPFHEIYVRSWLDSPRPNKPG